jgi:hypothetical protein
MWSSAGKGERFSLTRELGEKPGDERHEREPGRPAWRGKLGRGRSKGNPHELSAVSDPVRTPPQVGEKTGAEIRLVVLHAPDIGCNLEGVVLADG